MIGIALALLAVPVPAQRGQPQRHFFTLRPRLPLRHLVPHKLRELLLRLRGAPLDADADTNAGTDVGIYVARMYRGAWCRALVVPWTRAHARGCAGAVGAWCPRWILRLQASASNPQPPRPPTRVADPTSHEIATSPKFWLASPDTGLRSAFVSRLGPAAPPLSPFLAGGFAAVASKRRISCSQMWAFSGHSVGIQWAFSGHAVGMRCARSVHAMRTRCACSMRAVCRRLS